MLNMTVLYIKLVYIYCVFLKTFFSFINSHMIFCLVHVNATNRLKRCNNENVIIKVLLFCLTFVLLLSPTILLTACGGPGDNPGKESGGGSKPPAETPSAVSKNDDFKELYDIEKGVIK